jgi:hypothetical protein
LPVFRTLKIEGHQQAGVISTAYQVRAENSIIGAITHYVKPVPPFLASKRRK